MPCRWWWLEGGKDRAASHPPCPWLGQEAEAVYRAHRVFYLAEFYASESKYAEALVLYEHAQSLAQQAKAMLGDQQGQDEMHRLADLAAGQSVSQSVRPFTDTCAAIMKSNRLASME